MNIKKISEQRKPYMFAEATERILFYEFWKHQNDFTLLHQTPIRTEFDYYAPSDFDFIYLSGDTKILSEVKIRNYNYNYIRSHGGAILDEVKYFQMILNCSTAKAKQNNLQPFIIQIFNNGDNAKKVCLWNLLELPNLPTTIRPGKFNQCGNQKKTKKREVLLPFEFATCYDLPCSIDIVAMAKQNLEFQFPGNLF